MEERQVFKSAFEDVKKVPTGKVWWEKKRIERTWSGNLKQDGGGNTSILTL